MEMPKIDRRVVRTRAMLHHALMSMILEKGYEEITIGDICEAANVGRSTFYAHYTSKDDLRRSGLDHMRKRIVDQHRDALAVNGDLRDRPLAFSLTMFEHARDHLDRYPALIGSSGGAVALTTIRETLFDLVRDELAVTIDKELTDAIQRELVVQYVVGAYMAVLTWWLDGGAKLPPQRMDSMFRRLATKGITLPHS
jgi:AcrR family transcriptional regulator